MGRLKTYRADILIVAGYFLLPLLLFGGVTLGSRTMLPADNLFQWAPWASAATEYGLSFPHNGLLSDLILENYAWKSFISDSLRLGELPLWNPYVFAGTPFLATGQHSAYYPFSIFFLILPLAKAYGWYTISQLWLAGLLTYLFGRVLGMRRPSAAVAGLIFQGCGFLLVSSAVFPMILGAAIWLPLMLACTEMIFRNSSRPEGAGRTLPWAALGALALGVQILAGHVEITYYSLLVTASYTAWKLAAILYSILRNGRPAAAAQSADRLSGDRLSGDKWYLALVRPGAWVLLTVAAGLMLGAIQFIPFVEVGSANFREGSASLAEIRGWAFPVRRLATLAMPDFFGNPADHSYFDVFSGETVPFTTNYYGQVNPRGAFTSNWGIKNYVEGGIYLGILSLFLAALGVWSAWRRRRDRRSSIGFFTLLSALSLSFVFGMSTYAILYYALPGINQLHSPFRWVFPLSLSLAVLAGYGMDFIAESRNQESADRRRRGRSDRPNHLLSLATLRAPLSATSLAAGFAFWSGFLILAGLLASRIFYSGLEPIVERIFLGLELATDAFSGAPAFYSYEAQQLLILGLFLLAAGLVLRLSDSRIGRGGRARWPILAAAIIGLDLLVAGYGFNAAADTALLEHRPALIDWLKEQPGLWRLTTFTPHGDKPLNANTPWLAGIQDVRGYDSIILKQYTDYMGAIESQNELQFNRVQPITDWESLNSPLLDLLGVRYIVSSESIELPKLRPAWQGDGLIVYENLAAVPRAYTISAAAVTVVDDALVAMKRLDPRQFLIVEQEDWPAAAPQEGAPQTLFPAEITSYGNIEVKIKANVDEASWLVLNDTYFTGWDVFVRPVSSQSEEAGEEKKQDVVRVNGNFRGLALEAGEWEVRFRYSPLSFRLGGLTSFMGGLVVLFALVVWAWRRFYNPQGPLTDTLSIAKNSLAPMTLNLFNRAIDFVFAAFYLRVLGPADAGRYATAIIIAGWFEIISNWGLNTLLIREVAKDRGQTSRYLLNTSVLRLGTAVIGALPVFVYLVIVNNAGNQVDVETTMAIFLLMFGMVFSGMAQGLAGLFYAYEAAEFPAMVTTVTTFLKVALGVLALLLGYGFVGLAAVSIAVNIVTLLILAVAASRKFELTGPWHVDIALQRRMLSLSYPLMLNHLFAVIFFQIDIPLMQQINGPKVVGWYNSAYKWVNAFNVIPSFFTFALFPVITRQVTSSLPGARRTFRMSLKLMLLVAFPLAALTTLLAPLMIGLLGGREFLPHGAFALQLVIWSIPIGWMNSVANYVLIALGRERKLTVAFLIGVGFNVVANLLLLPRYSYVAASIITILSEIVLLGLFAYYLRPAMPDVGWIKIVKRPLAIVAMMLWAMVLGSRVNLFVALALGIAAYPLGLWLLRVFGEEERHILRSILPQSLVERLSFLSSGPAD
jgi:O-antigen/teichoic acid export membrane protein